MQFQQVRLARPVSDLAKTTQMYCRGLRLVVIGSFADHEGFDGVMIGTPGSGFHFEFTYSRLHKVVPTPTAEDLVVLYVPDAPEWQAACERVVNAGFQPCKSFNPYWDIRGRTFEDRDGYRVVLEREAWTAEAAPHTDFLAF